MVHFGSTGEKSIAAAHGRALGKPRVQSTAPKTGPCAQAAHTQGYGDGLLHAQTQLVQVVVALIQIGDIGEKDFL